MKRNSKIDPRVIDAALERFSSAQDALSDLESFLADLRQTELSEEVNEVLQDVDALAVQFETVANHLRKSVRKAASK